MAQEPVFEIDPEAKHLPEELQKRALAWPIMHRHITKLQESGFDLKRIQIAGVECYDKIGSPNRLLNDIFRVRAYVDFIDPKTQKPLRQVIQFSPDSVALYTIFRVAADEATRGKSRAYLMLVTQPRLTQYNTESLEPPGGGVRIDETPVQAAKRETIEETGLTKEIIDYFDIHNMDPIPLNKGNNFPALSETHYAFLRVIDVTVEQWKWVHREMTGREAGEESEWEQTRVRFVNPDEYCDGPAWMVENIRRATTLLPSIPFSMNL